MSTSSRLDKVRQFANHLLAHRSVREDRWKELATWLAPHRGIFQGEDLAPTGRRRNEYRFTSAATSALQRSASGITSGMTPRNISWFEPDFVEEQMLEESGAREYLDSVDLRVKNVLEMGRFYQAIYSFNTDLLWAGCALLYTESSDETILRFECVQIGTYAVELDSDKRLDAVYRTLVMTPARMAVLFGKEHLSEDTRKKLDKDPYQNIRVHHLVRRRNYRDPEKRDKKNLPWESLFWEDGGEDFLHEGGYHEMPYYYTCWHEGTTPYGTGPGDDALPDARQFDQLEVKKLRGINALTEPPMQAPKSLKGSVRLYPGEINYVDQNSTITPILDLSPYAHSLQYIQAEEQNIVQRLEHILMASIFTSIPYEQRPKELSATEFLERKREALQQLGPVISAYEPNVLTPMLHRIIAHLDRQGRLPVPPEALRQYPIVLKMDFISPMSNALRQNAAQSTRVLLDTVYSMAQVDPQVLDKVDLDQAIDEMAYSLGAPGSIIRADSDVADIREQRAQQQQEQQQAMMQQQALSTGAQAANQFAGAAEKISDIEQ